MGLPLYDSAVRTSNVTSGQPIVTLLPQASALGTGRMIRLRQVAISNTTATGFGVGLGIATAAGSTPGGAGTALRRSNSVGPVDPASTASVFTTYTTAPTAPGSYNARLWIPGNSLVIWVFNEGEEMYVPPAATPLPFGVFNTGTGQISDVTLSWEE